MPFESLRAPSYATHRRRDVPWPADQDLPGRSRTMGTAVLFLRGPPLSSDMHEESDVEAIDEVPLSIKVMMAIAFLVLLYVLVVDVFGFASLV